MGNYNLQVLFIRRTFSTFLRKKNAESFLTNILLLQMRIPGQSQYTWMSYCTWTTVRWNFKMLSIMLKKEKNRWKGHVKWKKLMTGSSVPRYRYSDTVQWRFSDHTLHNHTLYNWPLYLVFARRELGSNCMERISICVFSSPKRLSSLGNWIPLISNCQTTPIWNCREIRKILNCLESWVITTSQFTGWN